MSYKDHELNNTKSVNQTKAPFLDSIAESAITSKIKIIPVGQDKAPLIPDWQQPGSGSYLRSVLMEWSRKLKKPAWGLPCGPKSGVFVIDIDFLKNKNKKPIGLPIMGTIKQEWLDKASFSQNTQSIFQGKRTSQYFFKWEERLKTFKNKRVPGTTIDFRTKGGQVVVYRPFPPSEIWKDLNPMPDALFDALCSLLKTKQASEDWRPGNRNNTLFKKLINDLEKNRGRNIPDILDKADQAGLPKREIKTTSASAVKTAIGNGIEPQPPPPGSLITPDKKIITFPSLADKDFAEAKDPGWHVPNWLKKAGVHLLSADKGTGKTNIAFLIAKALISGGNPFFKTDSPVKKALFLYAERSKAFYKKLWEAHGGKPETLSPWRWYSERKTREIKHKNWTLDSIRERLKSDQNLGLTIIDRSDLIVQKNEKFSIRDALFELDELSEEFNHLFILTRHTSKPQGQDSRQFKERTDGFKEWQHTPSTCLMIHGHGDKLLLFKQYANECSNRGLIEFEWKKQKNGLVIPVFKHHNPTTTLNDIEKEFNPRGNTEGKRKDFKKKSLYAMFKEHGHRSKAYKPGSQNLEAVFEIPRQKLLNLCPGVHERTLYRHLTDYLHGWSKRQGREDWWFCPVQ